MDKNLIIEQDLIIYYPDISKPGVSEKIVNRGGFVPVMVGTQHDTKNRKWLLENNITQMYQTNSVLTKTIKNTKLNIRVLTVTDDNGRNPLEVELISPELDNLGFRPTVFANLRSLIDTIARSPITKLGLINLDLCFSCVVNNYTFEVTLHVEDENDKDLQLAKNAGLGLSKRKTSKWTPGHLYILNNKSYIIYLGDIKDLSYVNASNGCSKQPKWSERYRQYGWGHSTLLMKEGRMFLEIYDFDEIDLYKGRSIYDILVSVVEDGLEDPYIFKVRDLGGSNKLTGTDLGKVLEDSGDSVGKIKLYCKEKLKKLKLGEEESFKYTMFYPESYKEDSNRVEELLKKTITDSSRWIDSATGKFNSSIGNSTKTLNDFKRNNYYYNACISSVAGEDNIFRYALGEDKVMEIIDSFIPSNLK